MKRFAFFDVDNTIYNGYTAPEFIAFLVKQKLASGSFIHEYEDAVRQYRQDLLNYHILSQKALDLFSQSISGRTVDEIDSLAKSFLHDKKSRYFVWVNPLLEFLKRNNFEIILISAGPDIIIRKIAEEVDADQWFATEIPYYEDYYNGDSILLLNDRVKVECVNKLDSQDETLSIGFGDSIGDAAMLNAVDHAFLAMNNDHHAKILPIAEENGWTIFNNESQVIKKLNQII